jgi:hypothetical protein
MFVRQSSDVRQTSYVRARLTYLLFVTSQPHLSRYLSETGEGRGWAVTSQKADRLVLHGRIESERSLTIV